MNVHFDMFTRLASAEQLLGEEENMISSGC